MSTCFLLSLHITALCVDITVHRDSCLHFSNCPSSYRKQMLKTFHSPLKSQSSIDLWCTCSHVFSLWSKQNFCAALMSAHRRYLYEVICSQHTTPRPRHIYAHLPIKYQCSYSKQQHYCLFIHIYPNRDTIFHMRGFGWDCPETVPGDFHPVVPPSTENPSAHGAPHVAGRTQTSEWVLLCRKCGPETRSMLKSAETLLDMLCCCHLVS